MTHKLYIRAIKHHDFSKIAQTSGDLVVRYMDGKRPGIHLYYGGPQHVGYGKVAEHFNISSEEIIGCMGFNLEERILNLSEGVDIPEEAKHQIKKKLIKDLEDRGIIVFHVNSNLSENFNGENAEAWGKLGYQ